MARQVRGILAFFSTLFYTASSAATSDSTMSVDAGMEHRTVVTPALAVRRSSHSPRDLHDYLLFILRVEVEIHFKSISEKHLLCDSEPERGKSKNHKHCAISIPIRKKIYVKYK